MMIPLIFIFFVQHILSITLKLPLSEEDSKNFKIFEEYLDYESNSSPTVIFSKYYKSKYDEEIDKVMYHGVVLFENFTPEARNFRVMISETKFNGGVLMSLYIRRNTLYDLIEWVPFYESYLRGIREDHIERYNRIASGEERTKLAQILRNILYRINSNNTIRDDVDNVYEPDYIKEVSDIDKVDEEPLLIRGRADINPEEIEKQVKEMVGDRNLKSRESEPFINFAVTSISIDLTSDSSSDSDFDSDNTFIDSEVLDSSDFDGETEVYSGYDTDIE